MELIPPQTLVLLVFMAINENKEKLGMMEPALICISVILQMLMAAI